MKTRLGFVSNSSSSSFTCDICGATESGMDMCARDFEMMQFECGHVVCLEHLPDMFETNAKLKLLLMELKPNGYNYIKEEDREEFLQLRTDNPNADLKTLLDLHSNGYNLEDVLNEILWDCPKEICPICNMNDISCVQDETIAAYLAKKSGLKRKEIQQKIINEFGNLTNFREWLKNED